MKQKLISAIALLLLCPLSVLASTDNHSETEEIPQIGDYEYFFRFLPMVASQINESLAQQVLSDPAEINTRLTAAIGVISPFRNDQIKSEKFDRNGTTVYVWTYPEPTECPIPLYAAFVPSGQAFKVYFLERSIMTPWVVGSSDVNGNHASYNFFEQTPSAEEFASNVIEIEKKSVEPSAESAN